MINSAKISINSARDSLAAHTSHHTQLKIFPVRTKVAESEHGSQLVVSLAERVDSGEYSCQVSALSNSVLTHHVNVRGENSLTD